MERPRHQQGHPESASTKTGKEGGLVASNKAMEFAAGVPAPDPVEQHRDMTWGKYEREFINRFAATKSAATLDIYDRCCRNFRQTMQPARLWDVDRRLLQEFVSRRTGKVAPNTIDKELRHLRPRLCGQRPIGAISGSAPNFRGLWVGNRTATGASAAAAIAAMVEALQKPSLRVRQRSRQWWLAFFQTKLFLGSTVGRNLGVAMGSRGFRQRRHHDFPQHEQGQADARLSLLP